MFDLHNTDFTIIAAVEKGRPERLVNTIRRQRHLQEIQPNKIGLLDRILGLIGTAMVSIGKRLQERSLLVLSHSPSPNHPDC